MPKNLLEHINDVLPSLSKAERKVARAVLLQPASVVSKSITALAQQAGVSEPTVMRFCRSVGCDGFLDFRVRLAQSLVTNSSYAYSGVDPDDSTQEFAHKIFTGTTNALVKTRNSLDHEVIDRAIDVLLRAKAIECYGFAASGVVAMDAQQKFLHLRPCVVAYTDAHMQYISAATLSPGDVVMAISHTGRTKELLESIKIAHQSGATIVGISRRSSPLADLCDLLIPVEVTEDTAIYPPSISRIVHLVVIDVLAVGMALRDGRRATERMRQIKHALKDKRQEGGEVQPGATEL